MGWLDFLPSLQEYDTFPTQLNTHMALALQDKSAPLAPTANSNTSIATDTMRARPENASANMVISRTPGSAGDVSDILYIL